MGVHEEYNEYYDEMERANKIPLTFDKWKRANRPDAVATVIIKECELNLTESEQRVVVGLLREWVSGTTRNKAALIHETLNTLRNIKERAE